MDEVICALNSLKSRLKPKESLINILQNQLPYKDIFRME